MKTARVYWDEEKLGYFYLLAEPKGPFLTQLDAGKAAREEIVRPDNIIDLAGALDEMVKYTLDILTGPIMTAHVRWPEGGPRSPVIDRAIAALRAVGR